MFSLHDIIEIAIKVELNGARTYREASEKTKDEDLAALLAFLAHDEEDHARWFRELGENAPESKASEEIESMGRAMLRGVVGDKSFSLDDVDLSKAETMAEVLDAAQELELDTAMFYQMLGGFIDDPTTLAHLETIIEEEKRHGRFLEEFLRTGQTPSKQELEHRPT